MARLKVHINKPDPTTEVIHKYKYGSDLIKKQMSLHTFHGIRRMLFGPKRKEFYLIASLLILLLLYMLGIL